MQDDPGDANASELTQALTDMEAARQHFQRAQTDWQQQAAMLADAEARLRDAEERARSLTLALEASRQQVARERAQAQAERERAERYARLLRELQTAVSGGDVYRWILQACLAITRATRGLYLTADPSSGFLRIRSALEMAPYPEHAPSEYLQALCRAALERGETFLARRPDDFAALPRPEHDGETLSSCIVAPVVLLNRVHGVVLVADKREGEFDEADVQTLLHVGGEAASALENERLRRQLQDAYLATVHVLADAMEAKDPYTQGHSDMVSRYADRIARHLDLSEFERGVVSYAALLHDIGKIGVSDGVLNKPGPLLPEERALVRSHVRVGADLLRHVPVLEPVAEVVLHHHERWDGGGYPDGLRADQIPIAARIVAVVDAYSAMITRRSYKDAYPPDYARQELRACAQTQFDPNVVEAFLTVLDEPASEQDDMGNRADFLRPLEALFQRHS